MLNVSVPETFVSSIIRVRKHIQKATPKLDKYTLARLPKQGTCKIQRISFATNSRVQSRNQHSVHHLFKDHLRYLKERNPGVQFEWRRVRERVGYGYAKCVIEFADESVVQLDLSPQAANYSATKLIKTIRDMSKQYELDQQYLEYVDYRKKHQL